MYACLRTFYFPDKTLILVSKGMNGYKISAQAHEKNATLENVSQDFHDQFSFKDFHVDETCDNPYGFKLFPTQTLKMVDKKEHEKWKTEEKDIISFMKEKKAEFRTYQEDLFDKLWSGPNMKSCLVLIRATWQKAWTHMADGQPSTNAFLTPPSIYKIFDKMKEKDLI